MPKKWDRFDDWGGSGRGRNRANRWFLVTAGLVVVYVLGVVSGTSLRNSSYNAYTNSSSIAPPTSQPATPPITSPDTGGGLPLTGTGSSVITQIYNNSKASIFTITAVSNSKAGPQEDIGTGFLINTNGDIATNNHVVSGQHTVSVTLGDKTVTGIVIGTDVMDDLAIVHITPLPGVQPLPLGTAKTLQPGDPVIAIGNPFQLTSSVTAGIVSGLNRSMASATGRMMTGLVQTDAPLNPGNSGGPLFNAAGQVVGINTAIESPVEGSVGIGFAIPIDRLKQLLPQLLAGEQIDHPWIGISGLDIDPGLQQQYHLPVAAGVLVVTVTPGGPAAKAGIHGDSGGDKNPKGDGDVIVSVNGHTVTSVPDLTAFINQYPVGTVVQLGILRHGQPMSLSLKLGSWLHHTP